MIFLISFLIKWLTMSCGSGIEKKIKLKCSDGEIVEVEETVALESETIKKKMVEAVSADEVIELENVSSKALSNIMFYCRMLMEARRENKEDELKKLDLDFFVYCLNTDCDLDSDARYLEIMSLVEFMDQQFELLVAANQEQKKDFLSRLIDRMTDSEGKYGKIMSSDEQESIVTLLNQIRLNEDDCVKLVPYSARNVGKYGETMSSDDAIDQLSDQEFETSLDNGLRHRPTQMYSVRDHEETHGLLTGQNVEVSTYNTVDLEKMLVIINFVLEVPSAVFDQLSSVHRLQYAIASMSLSFVAMFLCIVELVYKCLKEEVTWKWRSILPWLYYPPRNHSKPFGNFKDIMGFICVICQCIFATINFYFAHRHDDNPVKISFWPIVFALGLLCSKFLEKPVIQRRRRRI